MSINQASEKNTVMTEAEPIANSAAHATDETTRQPKGGVHFPFREEEDILP